MITDLLAQITSAELPIGELTFKGLTITAISVLYAESRKCWKDRERLLKRFAHLEDPKSESDDS